MSCVCDVLASTYAPVQTLLKKIEAAASAKLEFPPGTPAPEKIARYKNYLKAESQRIKLQHRAGAGGREICEGNAAILDNLLVHLWNTTIHNLTEQAQKEFTQIALVAIGGYGRAELNPYSDIDFMFLHDGQVASGKPLPYLAKLIDGLLYPLWDIGLKIGYSVRDMDDCVKVANTDMQSKTSMIESRLIAGNQALFDKFQRTIVKKCVSGYEDEYIEARLEDQSTRRTKFGNSACMQEPNLKNGCGGLRDFQNLLWMAFFKYHTRSLVDLQKGEFVSEVERKQLEDAYDFLLRTRTEVHYHTNRAVDALGKNLQPAVAHNLGYGERSPSRRIEIFMRDLYMHMRNVYLITRTLEERMALLPSERKSRLAKLRALLPHRRRTPPEPVDGFLFIDGEIHAASQRIFRDSPRRLMRVFLHAQQRRLRLHPDLAQLIRNQLSLVNTEFRNDEHVRETFMTILDRRGEVSATLRAMHEVNFLGKYIPEFGELTCLVQHEFYHQYAADEHTLVCLEQLDRIWEAKEPPYNHYAPLFQSLERPGLLYLALLLHDVGKAQEHGQGKHAEASALMALRAAKRLQLDAASTQSLRALVLNHLLMATTSQRRDLDDSTVIKVFAREVGTPEGLNQLTLLTFADSQGTSDKLWNGFKDSLLWQLHDRAMTVLTGGTEFIKAEKEQRETQFKDTRRLCDSSVSEEELISHFASLPPRYFQIHTAQEIADDLEIAHRFISRQVLDEEGSLSPVIEWTDERDRGYNLVKVCTWDRGGLFSKIAGAFSAVGLNILSAQIFTRGDGIVLDEFFVNDGRTGKLASREQHEKFDELLDKILNGQLVDLPALIDRQREVRPAYQAYAGEHIPTWVRLDNDASEARTLLEIETEDRLGLLYVISQTFAELSLDVSAARIVTERGAAIDSFYVCERNGRQIESAERHEAIKARLLKAISKLETPI